MILLVLLGAFACFDSDELPPTDSEETGAELRGGYHDPNCPVGGPGCPCGDYERCADGLVCDTAGLCVDECLLEYQPCDLAVSSQ